MFGILIVHCRACNYLLSLLCLSPEELLETENGMGLAVTSKGREQSLLEQTGELHMCHPLCSPGQFLSKGF